ncbi:hypothetical protein PM1_049 [Pectobacterium phage PM1]|uniref:Tail assembly chaperone n=2 Tax=Suwonvirus TaxID=2732964 RepID=X2CSX5_9CAUD|nr:tail assembly chaperone [Pectobacterium phage PM1]YP_009788080.1 tail assembly chaperone [Pectobacterium phage PP101]AGV99265.1 hypothetical protein PM1_049 [Pectobacterium phage PM1]APD19747.1 putative tail protein [Pectobacterium phage PP101]
MACELIQREFKNSNGDPVLVAVRQLPASKALELHVELVNVVGNSAFPLIANDYDFGNILSLMRAADPKVISELMKRVVCMAVVEGMEVKPALFDMKYNNELMLVCEVFAFVCEANFHDFFKQGLEMNEQKRLAVEEASKQAEQKSSSPKI